MALGCTVFLSPPALNSPACGGQGLEPHIIIEMTPEPSRARGVWS
jgi:hypothetical protein